MEISELTMSCHVRDESCFNLSEMISRTLRLLLIAVTNFSVFERRVFGEH